MPRRRLRFCICISPGGAIFCEVSVGRSSSPSFTVRFFGAKSEPYIRQEVRLSRHGPLRLHYGLKRGIVVRKGGSARDVNLKDFEKLLGFQTRPTKHEKRSVNGELSWYMTLKVEKRLEPLSSICT